MVALQRIEKELTAGTGAGAPAIERDAWKSESTVSSLIILDEIVAGNREKNRLLLLAAVERAANRMLVLHEGDIARGLLTLNDVMNVAQMYVNTLLKRL